MSNVIAALLIFLLLISDGTTGLVTYRLIMEINDERADKRTQFIGIIFFATVFLILAVLTISFTIYYVRG